MPEVEYGDPERDELRASSNEFAELQKMAAWHDVKQHLEEVKESHLQRLAQENADQRESDFSRGVIAICNDITGNGGESLVDMLRSLAEQIEEESNGRNRRTNR